ncbi:MAG: hypothetical protein AAGF99_03190 [Bacteroidota bacterium]
MPQFLAHRSGSFVGRALLTLVLASLAGCSVIRHVTLEERAASVWAVDLVETLPGEQARYLQFNALNWVPMREAFVVEGIARSFRVLTLPPDSARGWDVMLMTEYLDDDAFDRREDVFQEVSVRPGYELKRVDGLGPRDLARVVTSYEMRDGTVPTMPGLRR